MTDQVLVCSLFWSVVAESSSQGEIQFLNSLELQSILKVSGA